jgi:nucleotide-binding universal stress UspA family protein
LFARVLFPTDCSERASNLVALVAGLQPRPEQVCAAMVVTISGMEQPVIEKHLEQARSDLEDLMAPLAESGVDVETRVLTGRATKELLKAASECRSDSVVIGSYGKQPMEEVLQGSLSADLTRHSVLPVLSVRFGAIWDKTPEECARVGRRLLERPLHPTDMSDCSRRALEATSGEARERAPVVDLIHVVDDAQPASDVRAREVDEAGAYLESTAATLHQQGLEVTTHLVEGDPVADILRLSCELDSTCIVLGSHGKSLVREAVVGSVSQDILRLASKPVLVVH